MGCFDVFKNVKLVMQEICFSYPLTTCLKNNDRNGLSQFLLTLQIKTGYEWWLTKVQAIFFLCAMDLLGQCEVCEERLYTRHNIQPLDVNALQRKEALSFKTFSFSHFLKNVKLNF